MSETNVETTEETTEPSEADASAVSEAPPSSESGSPADEGALESPPPEDVAADDGGTLADDLEDSEADESPAFTGDWRAIMAGGNEAAMKTLRRFQSPANFYKSYEAMRQKMSTEMTGKKPEGEGEELEAWRASVGIPDEPEGYLDNLPNGVVVGEEDKEMVSSFLDYAHNNDFTPEQVHASLGWYYQVQDDMVNQQAERDNQYKAEAEDILRADWGPEYRQNLNDAVSFLTTYGNEEIRDKFLHGRLADGTPIGNDPEMLNFLVRAHREVNPAGINVSQEGERPIQAIDREIREIEKRMENPRESGYYEDEAAQARYRELLEAKEKLENRGR